MVGWISIFSSTVQAVDRTWNGSSDTNWSSLANWTPSGVVETAGNTAIFDALGSPNADPSQIRSLFMDAIVYKSTAAAHTVGFSNWSVGTAGTMIEVEAGNTNNQTINANRGSGFDYRIKTGTSTILNNGNGLLTVGSSQPLAQGSTFGVVSAGAGTLVVDGTGNTLIGGIGSGDMRLVNGSGTLSLTKEGNGTLTLSSSNAYTGNTTIKGGTLKISGAGRISNNSAVIIETGGTLDLTNIGDKVLSVTLTSGSIIGTGEINTDTQIVVQEGTVSARLRSPAGLLKSGSGVVTIANTNNSLLTGPTTISNGTLNVTGSIAQSSLTTVQTGGTLTGTGTVGALLLDGGTLAPGASPGTMFVAGNATWNDGFFEFEIDDATGTAGIAWDLEDISGTLDLSSLTSLEIDVVSQLTGGGDVLGPLANFDTYQNYTWTFATAAGGIIGFDANDFSIDTSLFTNNNTIGSFTVEQDGNNLNLVYNQATIPEPSTFVLGVLGLMGLAFMRRRRR